MTAPHIKWPSIESLKNVHKYVARVEAEPHVTYRAKVKLHGTNAAIGFTSDGDTIAQSRRRVLTPGDDNHGFAAWAYNKGRKHLRTSHALVFGEWFGPGIMKGEKAPQVPEKTFAAFAVYDTAHDVWLTSPVDIKAVWSGYVLPWYGNAVELDFNNLKASQAHLEATLAAVEAEDPWVKAVFGTKSIGEGLVYYPVSSDDMNLMFKLKGEKHKVKTTKQRVEINPEVAANAQALASAYATQGRFEQCLAELGLDENFEPREFGRVIKWMTQDIQKEAKGDLEEAGLVWKDVQQEVQKAIRALAL